ncbi:hypothetical protein SAMD00019534_026900, partial [Acytostelium subglobosum LB1]|uniref:hypothetical protein n=1 Tax=Acytostelium subglobosum LB1 TaxID=1410327 RepID=UPI000644B0F3
DIRYIYITNMSESNGNDKKRKDVRESKQEYWAKKAKSEQRMKFGQQGCLFTFGKGREPQATRDMYNLLKQYAELVQPKTSAESLPQAAENFNDAFEKELAAMREEGKKRGGNARFEKLDIGCEGIAFIGFNEDAATLNVQDILSKLFNDVEQEKSTKSRFVTRIIPIQTTCNYLNIDETLKKLIDDKLNNIVDIKKYKIELRSRYNTSVEKEKEIQRIAAMVSNRHVVDLNNPQVTIIVEIIKQFCAMSVVTDYMEHKKYNLSNIAGLPASNPPKKKAPLTIGGDGGGGGGGDDDGQDGETTTTSTTSTTSTTTTTSSADNGKGLEQAGDKETADVN